LQAAAQVIYLMTHFDPATLGQVQLISEIARSRFAVVKLGLCTLEFEPDHLGIPLRFQPLGVCGCEIVF
jgi:hypothetical protein